MSFDVETASLGQLRDYTVPIQEQADAIRKAEEEVSRTQSERLEAKHSHESLEKQIWELIDTLAESSQDDKVGIAKSIQESRAGHRDAVEEYSKRDSEWGEAKAARDVATKKLLDLIDQKDDPQERMDFDAAEESREQKRDEVQKESNREADRPEVDSDVAWKPMPVTNIRSLSKAVTDDLKNFSVTTLGQLDALVAGEHEECPDGLTSIKGWGVKKANKTISALHEYLATLGVRIGSSEEEAVADDPQSEPEQADQSDIEEVPGVLVRVTSIHENNALGLKPGDEVSGIKEGELVTIYGNGGQVSLMVGEYELLETADPVAS